MNVPSEKREKHTALPTTDHPSTQQFTGLVWRYIRGLDRVVDQKLVELRNQLGEVTKSEAIQGDC